MRQRLIRRRALSDCGQSRAARLLSSSRAGASPRDAGCIRMKHRGRRIRRCRSSRRGRVGHRRSITVALEIALRMGLGRAESHAPGREPLRTDPHSLRLREEKAGRMKRREGEGAGVRRRRSPMTRQAATGRGAAMCAQPRALQAAPPGARACVVGKTARVDRLLWESAAEEPRQCCGLEGSLRITERFTLLLATRCERTRMWCSTRSLNRPAGLVFTVKS